MKRLCFIIAVVLAWLMVTGTALAMDKCLKNEAFARTGVITTVNCDNTCGNCNSCNKCNKCDKCNSRCGKGTATYMDRIDTDGYWLTSLHALGNAETIWIDGVVATVALKGCKDAETVDKCNGGHKNGCGWAVLKTAGYVPCGACPLRWRLGGLCCDQDGYYVDTTQRFTVTKVVGGCCDGATFRTSTLPDCPNCGAVVYDMCGYAVGIMVGGGKDGCGCDKNRYTEFISLNERMFAPFNPESPATEEETVGLQIPSAP